jgi:nucleotide-binding universal stress UspA family protein
MLNSVLLHLARREQAAPVIRVGVELGLQTDARVRGLTLLDTRRAREALECESAVVAIFEQSRNEQASQGHAATRGELSEACLEAGLNFDVRRVAGDPLDILPKESQFHDLVVTSAGTSSTDGDYGADLSPDDLIGLLRRGMQPLLVVPATKTTFRRVLLAYGGGESGGRAIRTYLGLDIFSNAAHRLLAVGADAADARVRLREMADYCVRRRPRLETGCAGGDMRQVLPGFAEKWEADLIVLGMDRESALGSLFRGNVVRTLLNQGNFGLFLTA